MTIRNKKIAIIGGGPGGLTLARLLQLKGFEVKVYERDINRYTRIQGGSLDLHTDAGLAALTKAGLMDEFKAHYRPGADRTRVVDNQANIHYDEHQEKVSQEFGGKHHRPEIDRGPLRDILLDSLKENTVVWNTHILGIKSLNDQWKIQFANEQTVIADIVIGADGANSKIRPFVTDIKPCWTGITMIEGSLKDGAKTAPNIHKLLKGGKVFAYGNGKTLIVSAKGNGSFGFSTSHKTAESWCQEGGIGFQDNQQLLDWFKKEFSEWSDIWWELFEDKSTQFIPRPQYCMPLDQRWAPQSNITLIGDAAHLMPPFAGEGVNMAMLDALNLSEALTNPVFTDTKTAIAAYEKEMFKRFSITGKGTLFNTRWMHQPTALRDMLALFSKNKLKQLVFMTKYISHIYLLPGLRKAFAPSRNKNSVASALR
ncbi:MAG TPA: NAD(P)/FAD-dependent oxidoreductase [Arachidicoccus sp.]|nr:NAD(P)/FAD-dependent oxidoreductase [Arachidicoccus sp.]